MEIKAIGDDVTVSAGNEILGTIRDTRQPQAGGITLFAKAKGYFRNFEYIPLDEKGVAESSAASGTPTANSASASAVDSFPPGAVWRNDGATFTILERRGETFRGRFETKGVNREMNGLVHGNEISWVVKDVYPIVGGAGDDDVGTVTGDRLVFHWHGVHGSGEVVLTRLNNQNTGAAPPSGTKDAAHHP